MLYALVEGRAERARAADTPVTTDKLVLRDIIRFNRGYWLVVGLCVTFYSAVFPFRRFANIFFVDAHGVTAERAAFLNGLIPLTAMFATPLFGLLVDKDQDNGALLLMCGNRPALPAFLLIGRLALPLGLSVGLLGLSFSLVPPSCRPAGPTWGGRSTVLGSAYALMTFLSAGGLGRDGLGHRRIQRCVRRERGASRGIRARHPHVAALGFIGLTCSFCSGAWSTSGGPRPRHISRRERPVGALDQICRVPRSP